MLLLKNIQERYLLRLTKLYDEEEAQGLFFLSLNELMGYRRNEFLLHKTDPVDPTFADKFEQILLRLEKAEPLQYILEKAWFMNIPLKVNRQVLIPRPETEELVDHILHDLKRNAGCPAIIDIGTGSGCIPIALKKYYSAAHITALEISKEAIEIAKHNALINNTLINFILADILEWEFMFTDDIKFDVIVSNPPYITPDEQLQMHANVLQFEPHLALFVEGQAPLLFYEVIASFALRHLQINGTLYFEINKMYGAAIRDLLIKKGFKKVEVLTDMQGADRMIKASLFN